MKRSRSVALTLMGASAILLQACEQNEVEAQVFQDLQSCIDAKDLTEDQCKEVYQGAVSEHVQTAPRYATAEQCAVEHGTEACQPQQTSSGGSMFMPLMMGYFAGRMLGGGYGNSTPLYRDAKSPGNFRTSDNKKVPAKFGASKLPKWASQSTKSRTQSASRGGFGKRSSGWGS